MVVLTLPLPVVLGNYQSPCQAERQVQQVWEQPERWAEGVMEKQVMKRCMGLRHSQGPRVVYHEISMGRKQGVGGIMRSLDGVKMDGRARIKRSCKIRISKNRMGVGLMAAEVIGVGEAMVEVDGSKDSLGRPICTVSDN
jgi:hypothetical protein